MGKRTISFGLSESEINQVISEVTEYKKGFASKCEQLQQRVADKICEHSQHGFNGAVVDDLTAESGGTRPANVNVVIEEGEGGMTLIIALGEDAVWVEFGSGVYHNGSTGSSPNPYGTSLGFTIGSFGDNGRKRTWGFYEDNELKITHGTPAAMPIFKAVQSIIQDIHDIAKEVFT